MLHLCKQAGESASIAQLPLMDKRAGGTKEVEQRLQTLPKKTKKETREPSGVFSTK